MSNVLHTTKNLNNKRLSAHIINHVTLKLNFFAFINLYANSIRNMGNIKDINAIDLHLYISYCGIKMSIYNDYRSCKMKDSAKRKT